MKSAYIATALALFTAACASGQYGSFVNTPAVESAVIIDVVNKMQAEFPVAKTTFALNNINPFGAQLDQALREKGFATVPQAGEGDAQALNYVLDKVYQDTYRVTIYVNQIPYARAYRQSQDGSVAPAGSWTKMGVSNGKIH